MSPGLFRGGGATFERRHIGQALGSEWREEVGGKGRKNGCPKEQGVGTHAPEAGRQPWTCSHIARFHAWLCCLLWPQGSPQLFVSLRRQDSGGASSGGFSFPSS